MRGIWRDYGLSVTLVVMFLVAWALQTWAGWVEFVSDQSAHGATAVAFGEHGYVWVWAQATFENWQSEFLQVFVFIVLTTFLVHKNSHESPDADYETEASLRRIEAKLDALERKVAEGRARRPSMRRRFANSISPKSINRPIGCTWPASYQVAPC
jgi:hypothetical protein